MCLISPILACIPHNTLTLIPLFSTVDDDFVNQEIIKRTLAEIYDEIVVAMSGYGALEYLTTTSQLPDLVLLDVMMPGMDGFQVLRIIRDEMKISSTDLPIIMLSAMEPIDKSVIQSLRCGANDYITKVSQMRLQYTLTFWPKSLIFL